MNPIVSYKYHAIGKDPLNNIEHSISEAEILFVSQGSGFFVIDDCIFPLAKGSVYFIQENTLHYTSPDPPSAYIRSAVNLSASYLCELTEITGYKKILTELYARKYIHLSQTDADNVDKAFQQLHTDCRKEYAAALLQIIDICYASDNGYTEAAIHNKKAAEAMAYINHRLSDKLTLDSISAALYLNKFYLCHLFKKTTGISISEYILLQRLRLIKEKLRTTDLPISHLAMEYGFSSFSYFSRVFKEKEGMSAREYRHAFHS